MLQLTTYGTPDPGAKKFRVMRHDGHRWLYAGDFTLSLSELPELIAELTDWIEE